MSFPTPEMVDLFYRRSERHIALVGESLAALVGFHDLTSSEMESRAARHDRSKFSDAEMTGYVFLNWIYHCQRNNLAFQPNREIEEAIHASLSRHRSHNLHHPEAHDSILQMTKLDMAEMVSDWHAISRENGTGPGSTVKWAREHMGKWGFSDGQRGFIFEVVLELEKGNT